MLKSIRNTTALAILALCSGAALAATTYTVTIEGPGGHSNGDYGNVNAVHAGARAVTALGQALPDAVIASMKGGATVNAIAADCTFTVTVADDKAAAAKPVIEKTVSEAIAAENAFRGVKKGDLVRGAPAEVRATVK
ncbi:MAG: peptidase dimerization domain-containing protein [Sutterella sp.]|nr:peptidase dimerization domain-containing protein [Sutterella sp.]